MKRLQKVFERILDIVIYRLMKYAHLKYRDIPNRDDYDSLEEWYEANSEYSKNFDKKKIRRNKLRLIILDFPALIIHELSHAIAGYLVFCNVDWSKFTLSYNVVHFNEVSGHVYFTNEKYNTFQLFVILIAPTLNFLIAILLSIFVSPYFLIYLAFLFITWEISMSSTGDLIGIRYITTYKKYGISLNDHNSFTLRRYNSIIDELKKQYKL